MIELAAQHGSAYKEVKWAKSRGVCGGGLSLWRKTAFRHAAAGSTTTGGIWGAHCSWVRDRLDHSSFFWKAVGSSRVACFEAAHCE